MQKIEVGGPSGVRGKRGVLTRLAKDVRGNTLALVGAALLPLMAMVGSSVDIGVAYMAKTRLQSACDSAALAGRRVLLNDTLTDAPTDPVRVEATKFFKFNFPDRIYGTSVVTPTITKPAAGTINIAASTSLPTSIMHLFGFAAIPLTVECSASQNFVNTDIVLILDTTGSMLEDVNNNATSTVANQKITALKDAVLALDTELRPIQTKLEAAGLRLRYGIVPYSSAVNVGSALGASNLANSWTYQTRTPIYQQSTNSVATSGQTSSWCNSQAVALPTINITFPFTEKTRTWNNNICTVVTKVYDRPVTATFGFWYHEPHTFDTSAFKTFSTTVPLPTRTPGTSTNAAVWNGCIEERATVSTIDASSGYTIPSGATDLDIDLVPNSEETRWKPRWPEVTYLRTATANGSQTDAYSDPNSAPSRSGHGITTYSAAYQINACPSPTVRLKAWTRAEMVTYVGNLVATGYTYHDIGMTWGLRLISDAGVFADSPDTFASMPVAKHIIFMTDGHMNPVNISYSSYGVENLAQRVTGSSNMSDLKARHDQRFTMMCNAAKGRNVSVWVVAFALPGTPEAALTNCASSSSQMAVSSNRAQLIAKFVEIGKNIGTLRLTE